MVTVEGHLAHFTPSRWVRVTRRWRRWTAHRSDGVSLGNATWWHAHWFARVERHRGFDVELERGD